MRRNTMRALVLGLLAAASLAGCGLKGDLERPAPLWGEDKARYEAEMAKKKAEDDAKAAAKAAAAPKAASVETPAAPVTP